MQRAIGVAIAAQQAVVDGPRADALDGQQTPADVVDGIAGARFQVQRAAGDEAGEAEQGLGLRARELAAGQVVNGEPGRVRRFRVAPQAAAVAVSCLQDERAAQRDGERQVDLLADDRPCQRLEHGGRLHDAQQALAAHDGAEQRVVRHRRAERRRVQMQAQDAARRVHGVLFQAGGQGGIAVDVGRAVGRVRAQVHREHDGYAIQHHALAQHIRTHFLGDAFRVAPMKLQHVLDAVARRQGQREPELHAAFALRRLNGGR